MSERKVFSDSVVPFQPQGGLSANLLMAAAAPSGASDQVVPLHFELGIAADKQAELEKRVAEGDVISPEEMANTYSGSTTDADKLANWLRDQGLRVTQVSGDNTSVYAEGPVSKVEECLQVKMVPVTVDGVTYMASQDAPSLPTEIGANVHGIIGLQPYRRAHRHLRFVPKPHAALVNAAAKQTNTTLPPYKPADIRKAYNAEAAPTGKGQTIAILIDTFPDINDLAAFWTKAGVNPDKTRIQFVDVANLGLPNLPTREGEETLDAEWTSGVAPDATIRIYASGSLQFADLDRALDRILDDVPSTPGMRQLSISLGLGETFMAAAEVQSQHRRYLRLAAMGVNVFVSTGDAGSSPDSTGHGSGGPTQAEYPASDPCVIAVGGTSLHFHKHAVTETGWSGSGGGKSKSFPRPAWQTGTGDNGNERLVPDVSLAADPNTGALIVLNGGDEQIGGTSWSAPVWAAFCSIINEARIAKGDAALPFLNPFLYPIATQACRDIVAGSNGDFSAGPGYDLVTGNGVPHVNKLLQLLPAGHQAKASVN